MAGVPVGDTTLLQRLKELDEKATPGPWRWSERGWDGERMILGTGSKQVPGAIIVADPVSFNPQDEQIAVEARNALPALVTLVEKAAVLETWLENEGLWRAGDPEYNRVHLEFRAALAPFVGEATQ